MAKLSLNLIIPLTSVFQPRLPFRHVILAQKAWREITEHTALRPDQVINNALIQVKKNCPH